MCRLTLKQQKQANAGTAGICVSGTVSLEVGPHGTLGCEPE